MPTGRRFKRRSIREHHRTMQFRAVSDSFIESENLRTACYSMIETRGAIEAAADIATLPYVDGLFIGPSDLSLSRGRGVFKGGSDDLGDLRGISRFSSK
jgi:4-hydroxy-2-oxoheptanedioate aldolase